MSNLQVNVKQLEGRINNQILGVKGLRELIAADNSVCSHPVFAK